MRTPLLLLLLALSSIATAADQRASPDDVHTAAVPGLRIFACTHSFGAPGTEFIKWIGQSNQHVDGQQLLGVSAIGGSRVSQHWAVPDEKNQAKRELATGKVDVLTLTPITVPDDGIENFVKLAFKHNPAVRVLVQVSWAPFASASSMVPRDGTESSWWPTRDDATGPALLEKHQKPNEEFNALVRSLNASLGKDVVFVIPVGQALATFRGMVKEGLVPGVTSQESLFTDKLGHPGKIVQALIGYCHFAAIYRTSPIGLPIAPSLKDGPNAAELNRILQQCAWQAILKHPLSGVAGPQATAEKKQKKQR
jgi:hypothetical protein